jgi:hypothetical protein
MVVGSEFQITPISQFWKIAKEKKIFFWHFCMDDGLGATTLKTLSSKHDLPNPLEVVLEQFGVDVYESYTKDSIDFLVELGAHTNQILNPNSRTFNPFFIGFKNGKKVLGTNLDGICYCLDGVVEIIALTDPDKFTQSLLGIEEEDLE